MGDRWQRDEVGDRVGGVEPDVVGLRPLISLAADLVVHHRAVVPFPADGGQIQRQRALFGCEGVQVDHHQYRVTGRGVDLRIREQIVVVDVVEVQTSQLL